MSFSRKTRGFTLIELLVVIVIIGILAAIALPNYIKVKEKAKEAEVKANLHNIQLSVERFAVDTEGAYPNYLIGGEPKFANLVAAGNSANPFQDIQECDPTERVSDPLLRKGYLDAYPRNPFTRAGLSIHQVQEDLPSSTLGSDPLRNAFDDGREGGTRFGPYCTSMGSVLADPRYQRWTYVDVQDGTYEQVDTWCNIEYEFWDMWIGNKPLPYLPGQFFFKSSGPIIAVGNNTADTEPILPIESDQYMLGGYGGIRTKGKDVLGREEPITYFLRTGVGSGNWLAGISGGNEAVTGPMQGDPGDPGGPGQGGFSVTELLVYPWTRSEVSGNLNEREGSPYSPGNAGETNEQLQYGNPNGIRDAIILVLTAGEDYIGDR